MVTFADIIEAGTALARSLGHKTGCIKHSAAFPPCNCGVAQQQAKALDDWQHLKAWLDERYPNGLKDVDTKLGL